MKKPNKNDCVSSSEYIEKLEEYTEYLSQDDKVISAFAFNTGNAIEELIKTETNNLKAQNQLLEARILRWYHHAHGGERENYKREFANYFNITISRDG
jgi:hypothetical protein